MLPRHLKESTAFRCALTGLWRYDFGDPYTIDGGKGALYGTDQCPQVKWLYQCVQLMQGILSDSDLLKFLHRLGDRSRHLEALVECSPLTVLRATRKVEYEVQGCGHRRVDFFITPETGTPVLIDSKCRIRELIQKLPLNSKPNPTGIFKSLPDKFEKQDPRVILQGGWIHTVVGYLEEELRLEFNRTDPSRLHFIIIGCWDEKSYLLARNEMIRDEVRKVFKLPDDETIILKQEPQGRRPTKTDRSPAGSSDGRARRCADTEASNCYGD